MKNYIPYLCWLLICCSCKKEKDAVTPDPPKPKVAVVVTHPYTSLTRYSIRITGAITDTGESKIIEAGFVVDTLGAPTLQRNLNKFVRVPDANGEMLVIITDIPAEKTYYLRAYAQNGQGVAYGNEIVFTAFSEKVYHGSVKLSNQQEVVEFGKLQYTRIDGSLEISGTVTDLSPLKNLAAINYAFNVQYTTMLTSLKGMDSLEAVNAAYFFHGMSIRNNSSLKSLEGLEKLLGNNGNLYIIDNDELTDLKGLDNLGYSHFGELRIQDCDKIRSLHGLEKLAWLDGDIMLMNNPQLTDISAMGNLAFLSRRIRVINNASLQVLNGFEKLHKIEGLEIYDNSSLVDLKGLSNMDTITDIILLRNNLLLKDVSAFKKVSTTEYLTIEDSPALTDLSGFSNLKDVSYKITIQHTGLRDLHGLEGITRAQTIDISNNGMLQNLRGLDNLTTFAGSPYSLTISQNDQLLSLSGLEKLSAVEGMVIIGSNPLLKDYCGLQPLIRTGWSGTFLVNGNGANPSIPDIWSNCKF